MNLLGRLRAAFWDARPLWRRPARRLRQRLSHLAYKLRAKVSRNVPPRVVTTLTPTEETFPHPALGIYGPPAALQHLSQQTETSWIPLPPSKTQSNEGPSPHYVLNLEGAPENWPPTLLESLLLTAAALPLPFLTTSQASPNSPDTARIDTARIDTARINPLLALRSPHLPSNPSKILGHTVPHITGEVPNPPTSQQTNRPQGPSGGGLPGGLFLSNGPWFLRGDTPNGSLLHQPVQNPAKTLQLQPEIPGPRTALFLLPFLAIGGAEHLLFDLLEGWRTNYRLLVVTLEPHRAHLGQTVDRCREFTPHVYTLGDWLPREAQAGAVAHLLRRYRVETLVSWNGTVEFYDQVATWRRDFPHLRICDQLYNHAGGWMERMTPRLFQTVDIHLAVNQHIAEVLEERGAAADHIAVVHHGVAVPPTLPTAERDAERRRCRDLLGLPQDAVIVGTFIRLHRQKRPLDLLRVARRLAPKGIHFLLAGGGPLDGAIDRELARSPLTNFTRLPLQRNVEPLYSAIDLCLSTSSYEGLPVFLLDGLARGLPCVATAVGEIPELLAHGGGVLVERPGDIDALAAGIESLLNADHRHAEGERGRTTVRNHFSLEGYRRRYEDLLFPPSEGSHA